MNSNTLVRVTEWVHHRLLWLLVGSYILAALVPNPGLWLRSVRSPKLFEDSQWRVELPAVLLSFLLFNAGLGVRASRLWHLVRRPTVLIAGVLANLILPVMFILGVAGTMQMWHNPREVQEILIGLALIASMPIAGSSTAWAQNADGDLALSIGLVVFTTCLSPLTTPAILHVVGWMAEGAYATALHDLANGQVSGFLGIYVLAPSLAGIMLRAFVSEERLARSRPVLKLVSSCVLLILCYANAAIALPQTIRNPDWDYLVVMVVIVATMCSAGFVVGAGIARSIKCDPAQRASLMFGLGMTNNGTGLVIAAGSLSYIPAVMLPIIFYNLVQHMVAAVVDHRFFRDPTEPAVPPAT